MKQSTTTALNCCPSFAIQFTYIDLPTIYLHDLGFFLNFEYFCLKSATDCPSTLSSMHLSLRAWLVCRSANRMMPIKLTPVRWSARANIVDLIQLPHHCELASSRRLLISILTTANRTEANANEASKQHCSKILT